MNLSRNLTWICGAAAIIVGAVALFSIFPENDEDICINIGTYGNHIYRFSLDTESLEFKQTGRAETVNGSYVLEHEGTVFSVMENGNDSGICSFTAGTEMEKTAELHQTGADPCFIMIHEGCVMTADYSGGSISVFPIIEGKAGDCCQTLKFNGSGPVEGRQESSHIHQLIHIPGMDGRILASDLGADRIHLLTCEGKNGLKHIDDIICPAGSGPRHMEFSKDGQTLYCIAELSGEVLVYGIDKDDEKPSFNLKQRIQADEVNAGGSADIHLHPSGKYLYTSHRLENDGIAIFKTNEDGTLEKVGYCRTARHPRNFMITPDGRLLLAACRDDKTIQVFGIEEDGHLTLTSGTLEFDQDMPSSITVSVSL